MKSKAVAAVSKMEKPDFGKGQFRAAVLPEEKAIQEHLNSRIRPYSGVELRIDEWGPHMLEGVVWPRSKSPYDIMVVLGEFDGRKPAKILRVKYRVIVRESAGVSEHAELYLILKDNAPRMMDSLRPGRESGRDWRIPYFRFQKDSMHEPRRIVPPL